MGDLAILVVTMTIDDRLTKRMRKQSVSLILFVAFRSFIPKIVKVENFRGFHGLERSHENFIPRNFTFITDARRGWKLDHETFIHKILANPRNIYPSKILVLTCTPQECALHQIT